MLAPGTRVRVTAEDSARHGQVAVVTRIAPAGVESLWFPIAVEFADARPSAFNADELEVVA